MRDYSCHTVSFIINAYEKSANFRFNNVKIGQGQLRFIIGTYFALPYTCMGVAAISVKWPKTIKRILHMKFEFKQPSDFWEKMFRYLCGSPNEWLWMKCHMSAWHLVLTWNHCFIMLNISLKYYDFSLTSLWKINISRFFPYKGIMNQIWPCRKVVQGQPRIIICANFVGPTSPMLNAKSQGHQPSGSGEKNLKDFYHIWAWKPSWWCDQNNLHTFG